MRDNSHIHPKILWLLNDTDDARISFINEDKWFDYPVAEKIFDRLERMLLYPKSPRMPNLLIYGESDNGKTQLIREFATRHPILESPTGIKADFIMVNTPHKPSIGDLLANVLFSIGSPIANNRAAARALQLRQILPRIGLKMLAIDDIHDVTLGGPLQQRSFLAGLRKLGGDLQISLVLLGTRDALAALNVDVQVANRFREQMLLPTWAYSLDFRRLLATFELFLPLKKPSNLQDPPLAHLLYEKAEGTIGSLSKLIKEAATVAVVSGRERIDLELVRKLEWVPLSQSKITAERDYIAGIP